MPRVAASAEQTALVFHALSDPTRLGILDRLRHGERCVCDLMDLLDAGQSRLSFHLKVLREAGLVTDRRDGRWVYYTLSREPIDTARELLDELQTPSLAPRKRSDRGCC